MKRILLIDDDQNLVSLLSSYLIGEGFFVHSVYDIRSALVVLKKDSPDLIISDIMIQKLNGYDFIKVLKLDPFVFHIPVIFLTAKGMTADRIKGYNLGCHAYLTKPFNPRELLAIIKSIFRNIEILQKRSIYSATRTFASTNISTNLTPRERSILKLVVQGYMNKEIAINLNIGLRNVEKYIGRLLSKMNCRNRIELAKLIMDFD
uniref:TctD transcriptional regulator n=1 Tax=Kuetzingia canaliculata TaxID=228262 RepID=A0A1Z1MPV2_KUECA|nr:hypothetical protein [Kuetzingia canaliculata]ARW67966.1 hypothetical protein [Kuetzingia canaliculata]